MQKKIISSLWVLLTIIAFYIVFFWSSNTLYWNTCSYSAAIDQCAEVNKTWGDPRSLPFVCPSSSDAEFQAYQVILDLEFTQFDNQIEDYLSSLEAASNQYYSGWPTYLDAYDEITQLFGKNGNYWNKYLALCDISKWWDSAIVKQVLACSKWEWSISQASEYLTDSKCQSLVALKLNIYRDIANDIIKKNKSEVVSQRQSSYLSNQWDTYSGLIDLFGYNLILLRRIEKKYPNVNSKNGVPN